MNLPECAIAFRPVLPEDVPLIFMWYQEPHVIEWYSFDEPKTLEATAAKFADIFSGKDPVSAFLMLTDGAPIGYIQAYQIGDHDEYAKALQVHPNAVGVDLFIGEPDYVHRGLGSRILKQFVRQIVFEEMSAEYCVIGPETGNKIAIRAYEKAGFEYIKTVDVPGVRSPEYLMICRPDIDLPAGPQL